MSDTKQPAISFFSKQKVICPICRAEFLKEEILSGGGRMIAGDLTNELRRNFEPSLKFGHIYPIIYSIGVCPTCLYAVLWQDFNETPKETLDIIKADANHRKQLVLSIFPRFNFEKPRRLIEGAASYFLALLCYEKFPLSFSPTIKQALMSLRCAWLCDDMNKEYPNKNYDFVQLSFYRKALFFYPESLMKEESGTEAITNIKSFGPDVDKNYGFDGVTYLSALLEYKYGQKEDQKLRLNKLDAYKRNIARIFGLGKSSKNKPGPLLEHSRALYDALTKEIKESNSIDFITDDE